jgi:hypothetical protein
MKIIPISDNQSSFFASHLKKNHQGEMGLFAYVLVKTIELSFISLSSVCDD